MVSQRNLTTIIRAQKNHELVCKFKSKYLITVKLCHLSLSVIGANVKGLKSKTHKC
jgi:hypothetical protein